MDIFKLIDRQHNVAAAIANDSSYAPDFASLSSPLSLAFVAQTVAHSAVNRQVDGSSPSEGD